VVGEVSDAEPLIPIEIETPDGPMRGSVESLVELTVERNAATAGSNLAAARARLLAAGRTHRA